MEKIDIDTELTKAEAVAKQACIYCGAEIIIEGARTENQFVCDVCKSKNISDLIFNHCLITKSKNPVEIATRLMNFPDFKMHCPEHHFLVPAVLLSAYCNTKRKRTKLKRWLIAAKKRSEKVPGAFCGTHGSCGAAVGTGIFISLITGATPLKTIEWELSNSMTGRSLLRMAPFGGPRCCKRVTFLAINEASNFLHERLGASLVMPEIISCLFSHNNEQCIKDKCPFYCNL